MNELLFAWFSPQYITVKPAKESQTVVSLHYKARPTREQESAGSGDWRLRMIFTSRLVLANIFYLILPPDYQVTARSLCLRTSGDHPLYGINPLGSEVAHLILRVSSEVTPQLLLELVAHNAGQSFLTCSQPELDSAGREYEQCVRQTAHQSRCVSREEEVCPWLEVFLRTCTSQILARCLTSQAAERLLSLETRLVMESQEARLKNMCANSQGGVRAPAVVRQTNNLEKITSSRWLRLG